MSWNNGNKTLLREEFVNLAKSGTNITQLCYRFNISRKTGYKWINRAKKSSSKNFKDRSCRPHHIVYHVSEEIKDLLISTRCLNPHWGAKKIKAYLINRHIVSHLPATSTINKILSIAGLMKIHQHQRHFAYKRFEYKYPNALWQMDFKGYFSLLNGSNCHPLTIIDDYSRYLLCLTACLNESLENVKPILIKTFSYYGLPDSIVLDHGSCWRTKNQQQWSKLTLWLRRLGIQVIHGKPYHPQTRGKDERLHRTLKVELINDVSMNNLLDAQRQFDLWRHRYNHLRPHEALNLQPPITRYQPSKNHPPKKLEPINYWEDDTIRTIDQNGYIHIDGRHFLLSRSLRGQPVALRPSLDGKNLNIFFCQQKIRSIKMPKLPLKQGRNFFVQD